jgi:hypothetical protein
LFFPKGTDVFVCIPVMAETVRNCIHSLLSIYMPKAGDMTGYGWIREDWGRQHIIIHYNCVPEDSG